MNYNIESVIRRLQEAQRMGKEIISGKELIRIATPKVRNIDDQIKYIDRGMRKLDEQNNQYYERGETLHYNIIAKTSSSYCASFTEAEQFTGIPRRTFYRWENEGIVERRIGRKGKNVLNLQELKETIIKIKQIKG